MMQRSCKCDALRALRAWARGAAPLHAPPSPPGSSGAGRRYAMPAPSLTGCCASVASRPKPLRGRCASLDPPSAHGAHHPPRQRVPNRRSIYRPDAISGVIAGNNGSLSPDSCRKRSRHRLLTTRHRLLGTCTAPQRRGSAPQMSISP